MPIAAEADDLESAVRRALMTTHAIAASAGRDHDLLVKEFSRQLDGAADRVCPHCQCS